MCQHVERSAESEEKTLGRQCTIVIRESRLFAIAAFVVLSLFFAYTIVGYPLILGLLARWFARPTARNFEPRRLSFIIPVHNGERFLADKLQSILDLNYPLDLIEILVVSDASTDSTDRIAESFANRGVRLLRVPRGGKPAALNAAFPLTSGEILVLTDVRQQLERESVKHLVTCFHDPSVGVVSGDLIVRKGSTGQATVGLYWRYERWIRKQLSALDSMLGATGPFYAIRREFFKVMPPELLLDDMYIPLNAFFKGKRLLVEEKALAYDYPTGIDTEFRRKVRTLAGNWQLLRYYPQLLAFRNRMLLHYLSYKLARLLLPWAAIAYVAVSFWLPPPMAAIVLLAQAMFYGLAVIDWVTPESAPWKRLSSPARTVVVLLAASACAISVFFVAPQKLWKPTQLPGRQSIP